MTACRWRPPGWPHWSPMPRRRAWTRKEAIAEVVRSTGAGRRAVFDAVVAHKHEKAARASVTLRR